MKRIASIFITLLLCVQLSACGNNKVVDNIEYGTYGLLNQDEKKNPDIQYEVIWGNVIWGAILFETIIAPIYFFGFSLHEPVDKKNDIKRQVIK